MGRECLWQLDEVLKACGGVLEGAPGDSFDGIEIDNRSIARGDIFVAIKGGRLDGHDFVVAAFAAGAGLAIVSKVTRDMQKAGALLVVDDPLKALEGLARAARARTSARIIAITGSAGKTSSKVALALALAPSGQVHASVASFNNHWGVPLSLARMARGTQFGIFEVGMNHAGEITPLAAMIQPHVGIITNVAGVHLGHFASVDDIADAKAELFSAMDRDATAIIERDSGYFEHLQAAARARGIGTIVSFGTDKNNDAYFEKLVLHDTCSCITARVAGETITFKAGAPGRHIAVNLLGVLAAVVHAGGDLARAALALAQLEPPPGRGQRVMLETGDGPVQLIDESYNANPVSMAAALGLLGAVKVARGGRRIAVLGDMLELGADSGAMHAQLAGPIDESGVDRVYACGTDMARLWQVLPGFRKGAFAGASGDLVGPLCDDLRGGDVVMVKGSLGSKMAVITQGLKDRFAGGHGARRQAV